MSSNTENKNILAMSTEELNQRSTISCMKACFKSIEANTTDIGKTITPEQQLELDQIYCDLLRLQEWIVLGKPIATKS